MPAFSLQTKDIGVWSNRAHISNQKALGTTITVDVSHPTSNNSAKDSGRFYLIGLSFYFNITGRTEMDTSGWWN